MKSCVFKRCIRTVDFSEFLKCVTTFKLVYYRAPVSAANVALLSCMYVLLCKFILVTVQINIHLLVKVLEGQSFLSWY